MCVAQKESLSAWNRIAETAGKLMEPEWQVVEAEEEIAGGCRMILEAERMGIRADHMISKRSE
jgi:hypothetical protein